MNNKDSLPQEQSRNQVSQSDVVLKKQIAPTEKADDFQNRRPPGYMVIRSGDLLSSRLRDDADLISGSRKFFGQNF